MKELLKNIVNEKSLDYIAERYPTLRHLCHATLQELISIPYIGVSKARELKSILDISQSLLLPDEENIYIKSPIDCFELLKVMALYEEEHFIGVYLDTKNRIIDKVTISKGNINSSIVHPREVFVNSIRLKSSGIIVAHNHPSGDPTPSQEDISVTKRLVESGKIIGIELLDHIIIGNGKYRSLKEEGII